MTTKNAVLLIVKQFSGIQYNALLQRIAPNYGSVNSARAALSRALKDMNAMGLIAKRDNRLYVTDKGQLLLHSEMKNKLLFKLHQSVHSKNPIAEIDAIVEQLSVLIERSKNDPDLLKAAKNAVRFSIDDLNQIAVRLQKRQDQLAYLSGVLAKQVVALQELDFNDTQKFNSNPNALQTIQSIIALQKPFELFVSADPAVITRLATQLGENPRNENLVVPAGKFSALFLFLQKQLAQQNTPRATLSFPPFVIRVSPAHITVLAPHSKIKQLQP